MLGCLVFLMRFRIEAEEAAKASQAVDAIAGETDDLSDLSFLDMLPSIPGKELGRGGNARNTPQSGVRPVQ